MWFALFQWGKIIIWPNLYLNFFIHQLQVYFVNVWYNDCLSRSIVAPDIVASGNNGQGNFRYMSNFILRDSNGIKIYSF